MGYVWHLPLNWEVHELTGTASNIYYNCDVPECCVRQWIDISGVDPETTFEDLMDNEITTNTRNLLGLHPDP